VTLGRGQDNDIILESPRVSRCHARLDWTGSGYVLEDLLSQVSRSLLGPASGVRIVSRGWHQMKGLSHKERVFEVAWR